MLTTADIILGYQNDDWEGFGYLGERRHQDDAAVAEADAVALAAANKAGLTPEEFFMWLNSKMGRWFGDCMFGGNGQHAERYVPGAVL